MATLDPRSCPTQDEIRREAFRIFVNAAGGLPGLERTHRKETLLDFAEWLHQRGFDTGYDVNPGEPIGFMFGWKRTEEKETSSRPHRAPKPMPGQRPGHWEFIAADPRVFTQTGDQGIRLTWEGEERGIKWTWVTLEPGITLINTDHPFGRRWIED